MPQPGRKPNSVPLDSPHARAKHAQRTRLGVTTIPLASPSLARSSDLPGSLGRAVRSAHRAVAPLFGLAPCGVLPAISLTADAVRSYRTFSPLLAFALRASAKQAMLGLPRRSPKDEGGRYIFCATVLQVALTGD